MGRLSAPPNVLVVHPSADVYGSDLQLLETVTALIDIGAAPTVALPSDGPLVPLLRERGAEILIQPMPVLRKNLLSPRGLISLIAQTFGTLPELLRIIRSSREAPILVNTVTIPVWILAGRLARRRVVVHVHEAEEDGHRLIRTALALPNLLASGLITNSAAAARALTDVIPLLRRRITVIHNGVPGPPGEPTRPRERTSDEPAVVTVVARLSPRKGIDVALDAVGLLRDRGLPVDLQVCGSTFAGYEWFEADLRRRAEQPDLAGHVHFAGYVSPTWDVLADSDVVIVPSRVEPFGNTAVEALLSRRPLVASRTQGLAEIVRDGENGLSAEPGSATSLADAIERLLRDPALAASLAEAGRIDALARFSPERYRASVAEVIVGDEPRVERKP